MRTVTFRRAWPAALAGLAVFTMIPGTLSPSVVIPPAAVPNFEIVVGLGQQLVVDTSLAILTDIHGQTIAFPNGNIFINSLEVKPGGLIRGQGPNPLRIFVTGNIKIQGSISVRGGDAPNVNTQLTAGLFIKPGGDGACSGGSGGVGNPDITKASAAGGAGAGAGNVPGGGGGGGESGLVPIVNANPCFELEDRHPAGGGGGSHSTPGVPGTDGAASPYAVGGCVALKGVSAINPATFPRGGAPGNVIYSTAEIIDNFKGLVIGNEYTPVTLGPGSALLSPPATGAAGAGRFIVFHRAQGFFDTCIPGSADEANPVTCPKARIWLSRITSADTSGFVTFSPPLPASVSANPGDVALIYTYGGSFVPGELTSLRGGQGGGGGGNAILATALPHPQFATTDRSGAGGGGGGGVLELYALGSIDLSGCLISCDGGAGGRGESSIGLNVAAGSGGGGSGGMIRIQSALEIVMNPSSTLFARGGVPGPGYLSSLAMPNPPASPAGLGRGGRGGSGLIQLHAPDDGAGNPQIVGFTNITIARLNPMPILAVPEFTNDPARFRAMAFAPGD